MFSVPLAKQSRSAMLVRSSAAKFDTACDAEQFVSLCGLSAKIQRIRGHRPRGVGHQWMPRPMRRRGLISPLSGAHRGHRLSVARSYRRLCGVYAHRVQTGAL
jgi:hypothetical protein